MKTAYHIAIEGAIGVGKTSLTKLIAEKYKAKLILEKFEDNPFLSKFYKDRNTYAFQTQLWFLMERYKQQQGLEQMDLFSLNLRSKYSASLDTLSIIALWKAIEMEPGYKQKPFNSLVDIDYLGSLGLLGKMPLDLSWFIKHSYQHAEINGSSNIISHALLLNLFSILDRVLVNMWAKDNNLINYENANKLIIDLSFE